MITYPELLVQPDGSLNHERYPILARIIEARRKQRREAGEVPDDFPELLRGVNRQRAEKAVGI